MIGGAQNGALNIVINMLVVGRVPAAVRGRAFATLGACAHGASMGGFVAGGVLVGWLDLRVLVAGLGAAGMLVAAAFAVPTDRATRRCGVGHTPVATRAG